jgi:hypothetical protein
MSTGKNVRVTHDWSKGFLEISEQEINPETEIVRTSGDEYVGAIMEDPLDD